MAKTIKGYNRKLDYFLTDVYSLWWKTRYTKDGRIKEVFRFQDEKTGAIIGQRELVRFGYNYVILHLN